MPLGPKSLSHLKITFALESWKTFELQNWAKVLALRGHMWSSPLWTELRVTYKFERHLRLSLRMLIGIFIGNTHRDPLTWSGSHKLMTHKQTNFGWPANFRLMVSWACISQLRRSGGFSEHADELQFIILKIAFDGSSECFVRSSDQLWGNSLAMEIVEKDVNAASCVLRAFKSNLAICKNLVSTY